MKINVISANYDGGQGKEGARRGPSLILSTKLETDLNVSNQLVHHTVEIDRPQEPESTLRNPTWTGETCKELYQVSKECDGFVLMLGGDHSLAMGSVMAQLEKFSDLVVVWVDAHADINTPMTTNSGNIHGCPVAFLMGLSETRQIPSYEWMTDKLKPSNIIYIGLRDVEPEEQLLLKTHNIKYYTMDEVDAKGVSKICSEIKEMFPKNPVHISFDIDSLDPIHAPSTGTPVTGGLTLREGRQICKEFSSRLVSFDLVEVNPWIGSKKDVETTAQSANLIIRSAFDHHYVEK